TYQANSSVLHAVLSQWGHDPSRDQVKGELRWLEEQQLVKIEDVSNGAVLVAKLTERGADVAAGRARVDGVKRPGA
ncbi:VpaChn25_0724 family phage protein, partial [Pseudomonas aeruginosa]